MEPTIPLHRTVPTGESSAVSWVSRHKVLTGVAGTVAALFLIAALGRAFASTEPKEGSASIAAPSSAAPSETRDVGEAATPAATESSPPAETPSTAAPAQEMIEVPRLVGKRLSTAQATLAVLGVQTVHAQDVSAETRIPLLSTNWLVTAQDPGAGSRITVATPVTLTVKKPSDGQGSSVVVAGTVPNVVCMDLQAAQDMMQAAGFYNLGSEDGSGQGRIQILDRDWVVIDQSVAAGRQPSPLKRIVLASVKYGESTGSSGCRS